MKRLKTVLSFNVWFAAVSALFNGGGEILVNWQHGRRVLIVAAVGQFVLSFLSTGVTTGIIQRYGDPQRFPNSWKAGVLGCTQAAVLTFLFAFVFHSLSQNPSPTLSAWSPTTISIATGWITYVTTRNRWLPTFLRPPNQRP